jgi:hypothetical protein
MRLTCLLCVLFLAAVPCSAAPAADTGYPSKPIRLAPAVTTPAEFLAIMKNDAAKYARVAKATGAQLN